MTRRKLAMLVGCRNGEIHSRQRDGVSATITARQKRTFVLDLSFPGVQKLLSIVAEAQRAIDKNERLREAA